MKKSFILLSALAGILSCTQPAAPEEPIPEGYTKVYFNARMDEDSRTELAGLSVHWQGNETIRIWYKEADEDVTYAVATIDSYSGKNAYIHAILPEDAQMDELIADINAWSNESTKRPFNTGSTDRSRFEVKADQTAVTGSFDPSAFAMGARWVRSGEDDEPYFQFKNLVNLLKVTVSNSTGKRLKKISLYCNNSNAYDPTGKTYWDIQNNGTIATSQSTNNGKTINLNGSSLSDGDYYFVLKPLPVTITEMQLTFYFEDGNLTRAFHNDNTLSITHRCGDLVPLGSFSITSVVPEESILVPFGTSWSTAMLNSWNSAGFSQSVYYAARANEKPSEWEGTPTAYAMTDGSLSPGSSGYIQGVFSFEFYAAESGTGVLSFSERASDNQSNKYILVTRNGTEIERYNDGSKTPQSCTTAVEKGDIIRIYHAGGASQGRLFPPISWTAAE